MIVGYLIVLGYDAYRAYTSLNAARTHATALQNQLLELDHASAARTARELREKTARARKATSGPVWSIATRSPWAGAELRAVRTVTVALDAAAQDALPTLIDLTERASEGELRPRKGRLPLDAMARLTPAVQKSADRVRTPAEDLAALRPYDLFEPVSSAVSDVQAQIGSMSTALDALARTFAVLPDAAGENGPRDYLLIFRNNAEVRATGGTPGSWAVVHAERGRLTMGAQGGGDLPRLRADRLPTPATADEKALFGSDYGTQISDVDVSPDFARVAQMSANLVGAHVKSDFDGVFSLDPVAMSYLLHGTGPVRVEGQELNAANTVDLLLNKIYLDRDQDAQDAFYRQSARTIFQALTSGQGSLVESAKGIGKAVSERRLFAWSEEPRLAAAIGDGNLAGRLQGTSAAPQVGVYFNDATSTKLEYYLRTSSAVASSSCRGGEQTMTVRTTLRSTVPADEALPVDVTGPGPLGRSGTILLNVNVFGPDEGIIDSVRVDGTPQAVSGGAWGRRQVAIQPLRIAAGSTVVVETTMSFTAGPDGVVELTTTPGFDSLQNPLMVGSCR